MPSVVQQNTESEVFLSEHTSRHRPKEVSSLGQSKEEGTFAGMAEQEYKANDTKALRYKYDGPMEPANPF
jgi:hypothetical protein